MTAFSGSWPADSHLIRRSNPANKRLLDSAAVNTYPILSVSSVTKRFSSVLAVDDLSFEVRRGEIYALLGPNGAGKSTTVRMLAGITRPDSGRLTFRLNGSGGVTTRARPALLGYLPEERGLYQDQPILKTLVYLAQLRGLDRSTAEERAGIWLERFDLGERTGSKVSELSKGNQQKVQFIASIMHEPKIAILDEPFTGFDPVNQDLVSGIIRDLRKAGMTIVLSAHHMDLVENLADYILLMHQGRSVLRGTMAEIRAGASIGQRVEVIFAEGSAEVDLSGLSGVEQVLARTSTSARLSLSTDAALGDMLHELTGRTRVLDVQTDTPSLREIYLATVGEGAA